MDNDFSFTAKRGRCKLPLKAGNLARNSLPFVAFDWTNIFSRAPKKKPSFAIPIGRTIFPVSQKHRLLLWLARTYLRRKIFSEYISVCTEQNHFKRIEVKQIWTVSALGVLLSLSQNQFVLSQLAQDVSRSYTPQKRSCLTRFFMEANVAQILFS